LNCGVQRAFLDVITASPNPYNFTGTIQSQNLNFKQGMVQQFNLNVEHQLPGNVVLTAGYAGTRSTHILVDGLNLNIGSPSQCALVSGDVGYDPNYTLGCGPGRTAFGPKWDAPTFFFPVTIANNNDAGRARYDSIQVKAETKSARHGIYALLGYTYSRTFDSGLPDGLGTTPGALYWPLPGTRKKDWALSQLNLNDQFTASVTYDLPFGKGKKFGSNWSGPVNAAFGGWEADIIEKATTGFPLFVVDGNRSGSNFQWNGNSLNRPDQISDPYKAGPVAANPNPGCATTISQGGLAADKVHTLETWFNPCAFAEAADGELGNSNRAPLYGPRFVNTDLSFIKHITLREGMLLDFRSEFFNLFNHAQFFLPGDSTGMQNIDSINSSFSKITQTVNNPRLIQFALKLKF
jgi:hypothetical protein